MRYFLLFSMIIAQFAINSNAEDVAVFPIVGVNVDHSFMDAFGVLLAKKYEAVSGRATIDPLKSNRALDEDSNYVVAAAKLGVNEFIELTAVGLYPSRKEDLMTYQSDSANNKMVIVVKQEKEGYNPGDQKLLDQNKTFVSAVRKDHTGKTIHKAELILISYGDIEEACDRFATALFKKITVEEARSLTNVTRREEMGHNKLQLEKIKGVKIGGYYPLAANATIVGFTSIGFNMRMESQKFFIEFGANGRVPSSMNDDSKQYYGGAALEVGGNYLFTDGIMGLYAGAGVIPHFNLLEEFEVGIAPYLQIGVTFPRNSGFRLYVDVRVAQNILPITTGSELMEDTYYEDNDDEYPVVKTSRPTEIGMNIGIGW